MIQFDNAIAWSNKTILSELHGANISCWLAGGCIRSYFMGERIKTDHDIFFQSNTDYEGALDFLKIIQIMGQKFYMMAKMVVKYVIKRKFLI